MNTMEEVPSASPQRDGQQKAKPGEKSGAAGFLRIWRAAFFSMEGIRSALKNESAFRQEFLLTGILTVTAIFLHIPLVLKAVLVASMLMVLSVELLNSAIEATVDYISMERHPLAKRAKDMGSAAVFFSLLCSGLLWVVSIWTAVS